MKKFKALGWAKEKSIRSDNWIKKAKSNEAKNQKKLKARGYRVFGGKSRTWSF